MTTSARNASGFVSLPTHNDHAQYGYDSRGNIATYQLDCVNNGYDEATFTYKYDTQNQLVEAKDGTVTYSYTYDNGGNITAANGHTYTYGDSEWKDLLTAYDGQSITYDNIGNPTSYYNGTRWSFSWEHGRELTTASNGSSTWTYTYDANGMRTKRTNGSTTYEYVYNGSRLTQMTINESGTVRTLYFVYDASGPIAFNVTSGTSSTTYYYVKNVQGDITAIVNKAGTAVVTYSYDAWGNLLSIDGEYKNGLGLRNPLRYRGYVYDTETGFYYLQSRYYDPQIGRFINSDIAVSTGQGLTGHNMFAYCGNNPVSRSDHSGNAWETVWDILSLVSSIVDVAMNPSDPWAWIGLAGDLVDVVIPFVGGVGEATRAVNAALDVADALDDAHDASKVIDDVADAAANCDALCFVAGTEILVKDGVTAIENIQAGNLVWAWNEETGDVALKEVVETYVNETNELVHVFVNGEEIITTPSHPFYSPVKGWIEAVHLRAGDILVLVNGEYVVVEKIQHEILESPITVFNFQVEDYHTYYVTDTGILVHNKCFRGKMIDYTGLSGDGMDAHHIFPQAFRDKFVPLDINVDNPQYGAWVESTYHRWISNEYNLEWEAFFDGNPTKQGAIDLAKALAEKYGYTTYLP